MSSSVQGSSLNSIGVGTVSFSRDLQFVETAKRVVQTWMEKYSELSERAVDRDLEERFSAASDTAGNIFDEAAGTFYIAYNQDELLGVAVEKENTLENILVAPKQILGGDAFDIERYDRVRGIGTLMVKRVVQDVLARAPGSTFTCEVIDGSQRFFERLGFVKTDDYIYELSNQVALRL